MSWQAQNVINKIEKCIIARAGFFVSKRYAPGKQINFFFFIIIVPACG